MLTVLERHIPGILIYEVCHGYVCDLRSIRRHPRIIACLRLKVLPRNMHLLIRNVARYPNDLLSSSYIKNALIHAAAPTAARLLHCS